MLLKRTDTDTSVKDMEGYTAFDIYNSTVQSAIPTTLGNGYAELLTWGANRCVLSRVGVDSGTELLCRNAALGLGDSNDRTHPDHVIILRKDTPFPPKPPLGERFQHVKVRKVAMSKLHTGTRFGIRIQTWSHGCSDPYGRAPRQCALVWLR